MGSFPWSKNEKETQVEVVSNGIREGGGGKQVVIVVLAADGISSAMVFCCFLPTLRYGWEKNKMALMWFIFYRRILDLPRVF